VSEVDHDDLLFGLVNDPRLQPGDPPNAVRRVGNRGADLHFHLAIAGRPAPFGRSVVGIDVGKQSHFSRSLDRDREESLVPTAGTRPLTRPDLPSLGEEALKQSDVLVVDVPNVLFAQGARSPLEQS
jgi:hypothetical protein